MIEDVRMERKQVVKVQSMIVNVRKLINQVKKRHSLVYY